MIEVRNLHKRFGPVHAVDGVTFSAGDGKITGLLGANGAGKTTTLAMVCGLTRPDAGSVHVGGAQAGSPAARGLTGALLDHRGLYSRLTARENIAYFGQLRGLSGDDLMERLHVVVATLGLDRVADRPVAGFSEGERVKVALGRALIHRPSHLVLDEPTNGLDIPAVHALRQLLKRLRDGGTCVIFSSHVLEEVRALCDRIVILAEGRVVAAGTAADVCEQTGCRTLEDAFLRVAAREVA